MKAIRDLVRRIVVRVHRDWQQRKLVIGLVLDREPNRLNIVLRKIFPEALPRFVLAESADVDFDPRHGFLLRARNEACVGAGVRIEAQRAEKSYSRSSRTNDKEHNKEFTQPLAFHVRRTDVLAYEMDLSFTPGAQASFEATEKLTMHGCGGRPCA